MASEWTSTTLGEFVRLQRGHDLTAEERTPGDFPVMGSAGENGTHGKFISKGPGVVIGRSGASMGCVHYVPSDYWPHNTCLYVTDFLGNDPKFTYYLLGKLDLASFNSGSAQPSLNRNFVYTKEITVPPPKEQRAIAHILGTLDDKIELNRRTNETLEAMARTLFKAWFVDFEPIRAKLEGRWQRGQSLPGLPAHHYDLFPSRLVESELGEIPEGWGTGTVGDLCHAIFSGGTPSTQKPEYWDGDIPWLSSGETRENFIIETEKKITSVGVENSSTRLAPAMSTVIASAGQGKTRGQTSLLAIESYVNQSVVALAANAETSSPYHLFLDLERRYEEFRRVSDAHSSRGSLTTGLIAGLPAVLPALKVLRSFDSTAGPMLKKCIANVQQCQILVQLRDALLPKLISGELRTNIKAGDTA